MTFEEYLAWLDRNKNLFPAEAPPEKQAPRHPGRVLREDFIEKLGVTQAELARRLRCRFAKINEIVHEKRGITPEFALQLEEVLGLAAEAWVSMQGAFDLWKAREKRSATAARRKQRQR